MRVVFTTCIITILISAFTYSQYSWELKQSGSSIGGPIDVENNNTNNIYYGSSGTIYKSSDRGETFSPIGTPLPGTSSVRSIILNPDSPSIFLVASFNSIFKTTNSGTTWSIVADNMNFASFGIPMTPDPAHPDTIYTMNGTDFMRSTDFGDTWTILTSSIGCSSPCDIEVFPDTSIILIGDDGTGIFKSIDYGQTWTQTHNTTGEIPTIAVSYQNDGIAWATKWGGGGGLLKSTDYGTTWVPQSTFNGFNMWGVHVLPEDANIVIAGCYSCGNTWRSKNGGLNWGQINISSSNYQILIVDSVTQFAAQGSGFYKLASPYFVPVELSSFTAKIIDNKAVLNWTTASEINNQGFDVEISFDNQSFEKIAFVPGFGTSTEQNSYSYNVDKLLSIKNYFRLRQVDFDGTFEYSPVVEIDGVTPSEFYLAQNHPNPFNPSTSIQFSLPIDASVKVSLFNVLGEKITELTNKDFSSGIHTINFNAEGLSSGTYLYLIEAVPTDRQVKGNDGNSFIQIKKMILLK